MSLCNTNWKNVLSGETHQPDVDFIVSGQDGERVYPAHRYLLAIVSPVFNEQFYGENKGNFEETCGRIKIYLDSSYSAVEAFFKYIFENCFGNLVLNDLFELLSLSERFQMEKMSIDVKEFIVKFIVDNKVETVEEISIMKKVEKDFKDKLSIMKDQVGQMADENNALEHIVQQYEKELKEKNEILEQALLRTTSFEQAEAKLKLDFNVLQKDRNMVTEEKKMITEENKMLTEENKMLTKDNKKLKDESMLIEEKNKNNMVNLQKESEILVEEKEVLVEENKALKSEDTDFSLEKERMDYFCDSFEAKDNNSQWSYTSGTRTLISIPTCEDYQEIERRATLMELENKLLKEKVSTTRETYIKALINSNARHTTVIDEKKLLEEEMEAMKIAYGTQIDFLNKEIGSLKVRHSKGESGDNLTETSSKEFENKASPNDNHAVTSQNQPLIEIGPKDDDTNKQKATNAELTVVKAALACKKQELEQLIGDVEDKNERLDVLKDELKNVNEELTGVKVTYFYEELTDVKATLACRKQELEQLIRDVEDKNDQLNMLKDEIKSNKELTEILACKKQEFEKLKTDFDDINEQLKRIKSNVAMLKKVEKNLTLAEKNLHATVKSLNEDKKELEIENKQLKSSPPQLSSNMKLNSSTSICISPLSKKPRLSFDLSDEGDGSEDLRMSLDQKKIRRVLAENFESFNLDVNRVIAKNVESGSPSVSDGTAAHDELDNFITIEIRSEEADELEDGEYVDSASGRSVNNSPKRAQRPLEKTKSARSQNLSPARHHTTSLKKQRSGSPERGGPFRARTRSQGKPMTGSRRQSSSPKKRPHSPERRRFSHIKCPSKVKQERKDFDEIRVTVQRKGIRSPPDNAASNAKEHKSTSIENVDEGRSRRFSEEMKMSIEKERMRIITMEEEKLKHKDKKGKLEEPEKRENKSHERGRKVPQVEECGKGKVFQRLGGKARYF